MTYYITKYTTIGIILFLLIYNRKAILSINKIKPLTIYKYIMNIIKEIIYLEKKARLII